LYKDRYSEGIAKKLIRLKKKDSAQHAMVCKKIDQILANPKHNYKYLHYTLQGIKRVHIGHFVLIFVVDHINRTISFEDYDHHDKIYKK
jgi:mRNA-degrading endonuclease RelE of RelBE toxin-antitoxin system